MDTTTRTQDTRAVIGAALVDGLTEALGLSRAQLADGGRVRRGRVSEVATGRRPARVEEVVAWLDAHASDVTVLLTRRGVAVVTGPVVALPPGSQVP